MILSEIKDAEIVVNGEISLSIISDYDVVTARQKGKWFAEQIGFGGSASTLLSTFVSELARNLLISSKHGKMVIQSIQSGLRKGIAVIAAENQHNGQDVLDLRVGVSLLSDDTKAASSLNSSLPYSDVELVEPRFRHNVLTGSQKYAVANVCRVLLSKGDLADEVRIIPTANGGTMVRIKKWL